MNIKVRLKNPVFWGMIVATFIMTILTYQNASGSDIDTWQKLGDLLLSAISNPWLLATCIINVVGVAVDPTTKGLKDTVRAMGYSSPFSDDTQKTSEN